MLNLGGMENSLPKTNQNPSRFRVARNVQPTTNGRIIPRSSYTTGGGQPTGIKRYVHLKDYDNSIFKMGSFTATNGFDYYLDNTQIPRSSFQGGAVIGDSDNTSLSVMSFRKNNTLYCLNTGPTDYFLKYDGVEITSAGTPQPRFSSVTYNSAGTWFIKVLQHRIDFDNNEPLSETVTFPILNSATSVNIRTDSNVTPITNYLNANVSPQQEVDTVSGTDDLFFFGTATYNAGTQDYSITTTETNIVDPFQVGAYVFIGNGGGPTTTSWLSAINGTPDDYRIIALRVKSVSPLVLDGLNAKGRKAGSGFWESATFTSATLATNLVFGYRKIFSVWISTSATGNFVLKATHPAYPESNVSRSFIPSITSATVPSFTTTDLLPVLVGLNLGDFYDVNTRKLALNTTYNFGGSTAFQGMTSYQDQILWWNDDLIYYSDPTLGGSVEHPSASSFIRVGDSEFGQVVSCCGTQDYLIVSRERKNYFINGNLATGNYRVQDISEIEIGAWCNNGTINIKESVILINAVGVWQIQGGGRVSFLGSKIPQNFSTYDGFTMSDDVAFRLQGFTTFPIKTPYVDTGLDIAFDEYRELLVFCQRSVAGTPVLVLHTKTGEFYEWNGLDAVQLRSIAFNRGVMYYGTVDTVGNAAVVRSETPTLTTQDYAASYPIKLYTTWLTAGEPSLEKQLLQLKMFGYITTSGGNSINAVHFKDWALTKVTNSSYMPDSATQFSHLKRLNSDKVLAASVGFEVVNNGVTFELESLEVEFNPIQVGVKR
jgi:hypothetical protein